LMGFSRKSRWQQGGRRRQVGTGEYKVVY